MQDVLVPWVMQQDQKPKLKIRSRRGRSKTDPAAQEETDPHLVEHPIVSNDSPVFQRYYHLFAPGELTELATTAATKLNLYIGPKPLEVHTEDQIHGVYISPEGWERSNLYVELTRWST